MCEVEVGVHACENGTWGQRALQMELLGSTRVKNHSQIKFPRNEKQTKHFSDSPISLLP